MKRISENRSKSAETLGIVQCQEPRTPLEEPKAKKQRQSTITNSVRRLFGSVKRLLPSRQKDKQIDLTRPSSIVPQSPQVIKKSAAMHEAELFLERLGNDWSIDQVQARITYLYRLVNDAFERAYQGCLKGSGMLSPSPNANDYMIEIRSLQSMISERFEQEKQKIEQHFTISSVNLSGNIHEIKKSNSAEHCPIPAALMEPYTAPQCTFQVAPACQDFSEGLKFNGIENNVYLANYGLSESRPHLSSSENDILMVDTQAVSMVESRDSVELPTTPLQHKFSLQKLDLPRSLGLSRDSCLDYVSPNEINPFYSVGTFPKHPEAIQFLPFKKDVLKEELQIADGSSSRRSSVKDLVQLFEQTAI